MRQLDSVLKCVLLLQTFNVCQVKNFIFINILFLLDIFITI